MIELEKSVKAFRKESMKVFEENLWKNSEMNSWERSERISEEIPRKFTQRISEKIPGTFLKKKSSKKLRNESGSKTLFGRILEGFLRILVDISEGICGRILGKSLEEFRKECLDRCCNESL